MEDLVRGRRGGESTIRERERDNNFVGVGDRERVREEENEYIDRLV